MHRLGHLGNKQSVIAYIEGRCAALQSAIAAAAAIACYDGLRCSGDDGGEGKNWQEESRYTDEHFN